MRQIFETQVGGVEETGEFHWMWPRCRYTLPGRDGVISRECRTKGPGQSPGACQINIVTLSVFVPFHLLFLLL